MRVGTVLCTLAAMAMVPTAGVTAGSTGHGAAPLQAQEPTTGEVRQLVTFHFLPGRAAEAIEVFRARALPLYERDEAMLTFRGFREVESPTPLDLVVISAFRGMSGMDDSNETLRDLAASGGSSIGAIYGAIASMSASHHDQFVEMLPAAGSGDPASRPLVALVWYRISPGESEGFERTVTDRIAPWERDAGVPATTGRFLVSDGWHYLRFLGFDSLGDYQAYWTDVARSGHHAAVDAITVERREAILAPVDALSVR